MSSFNEHDYLPNNSTQNNSSSFEEPRLDETIFDELNNAVLFEV
jgi:hypothetical protein